MMSREELIEYNKRRFLGVRKKYRPIFEGEKVFMSNEYIDLSVKANREELRKRMEQTND